MDNLLDDRYKILNQFGSGGFGETFLAEDTQTARKVVVKSLKPIHQQTTAEITERLFQKEASVLKDLGSQCTQIPTLYDYFSQDSKYYLVQEYIDGQNLAQMGVITSAKCLKILSSLLETLKYIHSKNIIHRDIKPENIIIRKSDRLPVLIDFGAVKETMGVMSIPSGSTVSSVVVGTRVFMPPEQSTGRTVFSSDLYSLALTLISALTGKLPTEIPASHITGELDWQKLVINLDPVLDQVLSKASKMDIPSRYPTAEEMLDALKSASLSESITVTKPIQLTKKKVSKKPPITTNPPQTISVITTPIIPTVSEISNPPITTTTITNPISSNSQPSAKSNNLMAIVLTSILVALGVSVGFWLLTQKNQEQLVQPSPQNEIEENNQLKIEETERELAEKQRQLEQTQMELAEKQREIEEKKRLEIEQNNSQYQNKINSLTQDQALYIVQRWYEAKPRIFGIEFNDELVNELTTGKLYNDTTKFDGSVNWLKNNGCYYTYEYSNIDRLISFDNTGSRPKLNIEVSEELQLHGSSSAGCNNPPKKYTKNVTYWFEKENDNWKIYHYEVN